MYPPFVQPLTPQFNSLNAVAAGAETLGGLIRDKRLALLSDDVRAKRDKLEAAQTAAKAAIKSGKSTLDWSDAFDAQAKVDTATFDALQAQARLDRAQNESALWMAGTGALRLGAALGHGYGAGVPWGPGAQMAAPAMMAPQGYGGAPAIAPVSGYGGGILLPAAAGGVAGYVAGSYASRGVTDPRP